MKKSVVLLFALCAFCLASNARTVTGSVKSGNKKLSGVIVTDGVGFTKTKSNGKFTLDIKDDAEFVYLVTPSGYAGDWSTGTPQFYQKTEGKDVFDFDLKQLKGGPSYNLIAVGDPQPRKEKHFKEFAGVPLNDMCEHIASLENQTVGIVLGDICFDVLPLQESWKKEIPRTGIPFYPVIGNHDHDRQYNNDKEAPGVYRKNFGPENYAFFLGDDIVIALDNIIYNGRSNYIEGYTDDIIAWVDGLMELVPQSAAVYVVQHCPLNGRHYTKMVYNYEKMLDILEGRTVNFVSGHNHTTGNFEYSETMREHNVAAICGTWWDTYHCTDGTPRGYRVFVKKDGKVTWYYKSIGRDRNFQFEVYKPGMARLNPESVVVNVWDYDPCWRIDWYEDDVYKGIMKQVEEYSPLHARDLEAAYKKTGKTPSDYRRTKVAKHYFAAKPSSETTKFTVVVKDRFGNVWKEDILLK